MNIVRENRDNQTCILKVTVGEADYSSEVDKKLRDYKRKANIPGFRPGMVPMGIISKMYRKGAVAETAYKIASDSCFEYIKNENIDYMGDVLPSNEQGDFDFDNNTEHEFIFELGLAPEIVLNFDEKDKITRYIIKPTDEMRSGYRANFLRRYGRLVEVEAVEKDEALTVTLDNGDIKVEDAYVGLISMGDDERKQFIGKKVGDQMIVNVNELYKTAAQRASILKVKENELDDIKPEFNLKIDAIKKYADPEMNEEFFKEAFPNGEVTDEEGLNKYIDAQIQKELDQESDYIFTDRLKKQVMAKANLTLPETFLRRWLFEINEGKVTEEEIDKDFAAFVEMMKWSTIQKHYVKENNIELTNEEVTAEAKAMSAAQFAQYGMMNIGDEMLDNYANQILKNKQEANKIVDKLFEKKVIDVIAGLMKVSSKSVTFEELGKILEKENKK